MAQLLEAQAANRPLSADRALNSASRTTEGDVLRVGQTGSSTATATPTAMGSSAGGEIKQDAWFAQKMMMGLEKYQKARGAVPLARTTPIDA
jgi:hypothetical protein